ncbi:MAG: hypothetical protein ACI8R8_003442, partial [Paraglaciecola sp.]
MHFSSVFTLKDIGFALPPQVATSRTFRQKPIAILTQPLVY